MALCWLHNDSDLSVWSIPKVCLYRVLMMICVVSWFI